MSPGRTVSEVSSNEARVWLACADALAVQNNNNAVRKFSAKRTPSRCLRSLGLQQHSSVLRPLSSVLRPLSSVLCLPSLSFERIANLPQAG